MSPTVDYLSDDEIDDDADRLLRELLSACFTKPQDVVFKNRRYFQEPYRHRWVMRDEQGAFVAHVGVHEKRVAAQGKTYAIGGIAEVCVHPRCRHRGYVGMMLAVVHAWLMEHGFSFAILFGHPEVYGSSGYVEVGNLVHGGENDVWHPVGAMVKVLSDAAWPLDEVRLAGPTF